MNEDDLRARFPRASEAFLRANLPAGGAGPIAEPEPVVRPEPLAKGETEKRDCSRFLVCLVSVRKRLLDEDNLCAKYHVDLLRYAGVLPVDSPDRCHIETTQRKAANGEAESTIIEVYVVNKTTN